MNNLSHLLIKLLNDLTNAKRQPFKGHELASFIRNELPTAINTLLQNTLFSSYTVKGHPGMGNWADIVWIELINPKITKSVQSEIYPTYLFKYDGSGFYLSLQQGANKLPKEKINALENFRSELSVNIPEIKNWNTGGIDLYSGAGNSIYEKTNLASKYYEKDKIPSDEELIKDLEQMFSLYEKVTSYKPIKYEEPELSMTNIYDKPQLCIPKPFLLLAGVSGTGKSRFVREQVPEGERKERYQLVAVRPDWHEPSDLLGYVSRLSGKAEYVMTDVLKFIVKAWQAIENAGLIQEGKITGNLTALEQVKPYWLCLDEMNLAPVEQYFADYLAVLETREWKWSGEEFAYKTDSLLSPSTWADTNIKEKLNVSATLWEFFEKNGIGIPFNLIVAGTVNMDETTHAFSRKVLDRALSFDFSKFYPNDFEAFFAPQTQAKSLTYPIYSQAIEQNDNTQKSIEFLTALNEKLKDTPFELAYRALNELLLSVSAFQPKDDRALQAVWDDFVMTKVLPRIEGDENKVDKVLDNLEIVLKAQLKDIWEDKRPDLWRENVDDSELEIDCRCKPKLARMKDQLDKRGMVSFW